MAQIIGLPKLSPTMEEGVLVRWTKKEGDKTFDVSPDACISVDGKLGPLTGVPKGAFVNLRLAADHNVAGNDGLIDRLGHRNEEFVGDDARQAVLQFASDALHDGPAPLDAPEPRVGWRCCALVPRGAHGSASCSPAGWRRAVLVLQTSLR